MIAFGFVKDVREVADGVDKKINDIWSDEGIVVGVGVLFPCVRVVNFNLIGLVMVEYKGE